MLTNQERFDHFSNLLPGDSIICRGEDATVISVQHYEPNDMTDAKDCPLRMDWFRVRVITDNGSRWAAVPDDSR